MINSAKYIFLSIILFIKLCFFVSFDKKVKSNKTEIVIYVNQWFRTNCYIFSLFSGIFFFRNGYKILFVFDNFVLRKKSNFFDRFFNFLILANLNIIKFRSNSKIKYTKLKDYNIEKKSIISEKKLNYFYKLNIYRNTRFEDSYKSWIEQSGTNFKKFKNHSRRIYEFIMTKKNSFFIIPGGIANTTCFFRTIMNKYKINYLSFDSFNSPDKKNKFVHLCINGIAAQREDAYHSYKLAIKNQIKFMKQSEIDVYKEIIKRSKGVDKLNFQSKELSKIKEREFIFIPLGTTWDSASLGTHHIFKNTSDWLISTINFFKKNYPNQKLIIKEHPHLRLKNFQNSESFKKICLKKNVLFLDRFTNVDTYDLIKSCKFVISAVSTVALESLILKKNTVLVGKNVFTKFKIFKKISNKKEFFTALKFYMKQGNVKKINKKAIYCYFFCEMLRHIKTEVTPDTNLIPFLSERKIMNTVTYKIMKKMIQNNQPYSYVALKLKRNQGFV